MCALVTLFQTFALPNSSSTANSPPRRSMPDSAEARDDVCRLSYISCRINSSTPHQGCRPGNECRDDSGVCGGVVMQNTQQPCHSPIVTLGLDPRVQRRVTERLPWMLGSSPSLTIGYVAKGVRTEATPHGNGESGGEGKGVC